MSVETTHELLIHELQDLLSAERQIVKALPKMAEAASDPKLRTAFNNHLKETTEHVRRLEQAFELLDESPKGKKCKGMEGLLHEGSKIAKEKMSDELRDFAMITAAQKVEHYEMVAYVSVCRMADELDMDEVSDLLRETFEEEKAADDLLSEIAQESERLSEAAD